MFLELNYIKVDIRNSSMNLFSENPEKLVYMKLKEELLIQIFLYSYCEIMGFFLYGKEEKIKNHWDFNISNKMKGYLNITSNLKRWRMKRFYILVGKQISLEFVHSRSISIVTGSYCKVFCNKRSNESQSYIVLHKLLHLYSLYCCEFSKLI